MGALTFELPFPLRKAKLDTLSGQELGKYAQLADNRIFAEWHHLFAEVPSLRADDAVGHGLGGLAVGSARFLRLCRAHACPENPFRTHPRPARQYRPPPLPLV